MQIRSKTLRWLLVLGTFVVGLIIAVQLFWMQKIYSFEQKQFNINVSKSIRSMYEDLNVLKDSSYSFERNIQNPQPNFYIISLDTVYPLADISRILGRELTDFDIFTDCKIGLHVKGKTGYVEEQYIDMPDANFSPRKNATIPVVEEDRNFVVLYFPNRTRYVIRQMMFWLVSGGLLIVVLIAFGVSIFYLFRQKFLYETQKDFVNNFTHEFKTPLSVIKIAADVLKDPAIVHRPEKLANYAQIIQQQTLHLEQQTARLLRIAFDSQKSLPLQKERFSVKILLEEALKNLEPLIEKRAGIVKISDETNDSFLYADRSYMLLAFINLIENAMKYSLHPWLQILLSIQGDDFCILFRDNGIGIEKKHHKRIFDKFYRVTSGDIQEASGFGLGLNFVKTIIETHKGKIEVQSETGKGSSFIIRIPRT
ncbi:MAG: sensor histidine kinase [Ferruginibacter sp.]|nr:sensor histidine kinase [Ferruginibacter sp.]